VKILAIDTASANCSAALLLGTEILTRARHLEREHAEHVLPMVDELLRTADLALRELDAVAFGRGPGAFTGLRLAASVAQGLAFGAELPVVPVSDLQALAQQALLSQTAAARVVVCTDARMREVYWACFEAAADGLAELVGPERLGSAASVDKPSTWKTATAAVCGAGTGFAVYPELGALNLAPVLPDLLPRAQEIAALAATAVRAGRTVIPELALPVYLRDEVTRPPEAQSSN
jgi:tRNA threonylcarbamoyladenosine biosynthesis protein TsaB